MKIRALFILLTLVLSIDPILSNAFSAAKVKANGTMTSLESYGKSTSAVIDKYIYAVDPSAKILDRNKKPVPLRSFKLPIRVDYEYRYTPKGPVIIMIEEIPDVVPR